MSVRGCIPLPRRSLDLLAGALGTRALVIAAARALALALTHEQQEQRVAIPFVLAVFAVARRAVTAAGAVLRQRIECRSLGAFVLTVLAIARRAVPTAGAVGRLGQHNWILLLLLVAGVARA